MSADVVLSEQLTWFVVRLDCDDPCGKKPTDKTAMCSPDTHLRHKLTLTEDFPLTA